MSTAIQHTGFLLPQSVVSSGEITSNPWTQQNNILQQDSLYALSNPAQGLASDIIIGNYSPNLPQDAVVVGIALKLFGYSGPVTIPATELTLYAYDDTGAVPQLYPYLAPISLTQAPDEYDLGSPTYLFSVSWTVDQINNLKFALVANGQILVDTLVMDIYYYVEDTIIPIDPGAACLNCQMPLQIPPVYLRVPLSADVSDPNSLVMITSPLKYADGRYVQVSDITECGIGYLFMTLDQGKININGNNFTENAKSNFWETLPDGDTRWVFNSITERALEFKGTGQHNIDLLSEHDPNSEVVFSNSVPFYNIFVRACQAGIVFSKPISVLLNGTLIANPVTKFNFMSGFSVVQDSIDPEQVNINAVSGGTTPPQVQDVTKYTSFDVQVDHGEALLNVSGLNRGAVVQILTEELATITSVEVGGVPCTMVTQTTDVGTNQRNEIWTCVNPPLGAQLVTVDLDIDAFLTFGAEALSEIDITDMVGVVATPTSAVSTTPSISLITDRDNSIVIDSLGTAQTPILYAQGSAQALNWSYTANNVTRQGGSSVESAGLQPDTISMDYTITQNTRWTMCAIEIHGITAATTAGVSAIVAGVNVTISSTGPGGTGIVTINSTGGGGSASEVVSPVITQNAHGFAVGDLIYCDANDHYDLAIALSTSPTDVRANAIGKVLTVPTVNTFTYAQTLIQDSTGTIPAGTAGQALWLSATTPGAITATKPSSVNSSYLDVPVGTLIDSGNTMDFHIEQGSNTGSGGGNTINNIDYFDDFIDSVLISGERYSGNFRSVSTTLSPAISSEQDHWGMVNIDDTGANEDWVGYSSEGTAGLIDTSNSFVLSYLARSIRPGASFDTIIGIGSGVSYEVYIRLSSIISGTFISVFDGASSSVTAVPLPTSGDFFNVVFDWDSVTSIMTISVDGVVLYSGSVTFSAKVNAIFGNVTGTSTTSLNVDYVSLTSTLNR
jgi:hypothetical protein